MNVRCRCLLLLVFSFVAVQGIPSADTLARETTQTLGKSTLVSGDRTAWMRVRLPAPVKVSAAPFDNPLVTVLSGGDVAGLVLKQDVPIGGVEVVGLTVDLCSKQSCEGEPLSLVKVFDPEGDLESKKVKLPAGDYRLYLIADGAPTRAQLRLPGLSGRQTLTPTARARARFGDPAATLRDPAGPYVYQAEQVHDLGSPGISFVAFELDTDYFAAINFSSCLEPVQQELGPAENAACDGGRTAGNGAFVSHTLEGGRKIVASMGLIDAGTWEHRLQYRTAAVARGFKAREFSLSYGRGDRADKWLYTLAFSL